jgi:hypothetical protein
MPFNWQLTWASVQSQAYSVPERVARMKQHFRAFHLFDFACLSVLLSVRMEQLGSHWTDFDEILYLIFFRNSVKKIRFILKSDKNNGYFT